MEILELIKQRAYLEAGTLLHQKGNINFMLEGKTLAHIMAEDSVYFLSFRSMVATGKFEGQTKEQLIQGLSGIYKLEPKKVAESLQTLTECSFYKIEGILEKLIKMGLDLQKTDLIGRTAIDIQSEYAEIAGEIKAKKPKKAI